MGHTVSTESNEAVHPYQNLTPDLVLDAIESVGYHVNGRLFPLNSYENRVYQVGIEDSTPLIAKFYRPRRWSAEQLGEEHGFVAELEAREIPVVGAIPLSNGDYVAHWKGFDFALYPQRGGQAPDVSMPDTLFRIGQWLAQIHQVGAIKPFRARPAFHIVESIQQCRDFLLGSGFIPDELRTPYESLIADLLPEIERNIKAAGETASIRLHGDCHLGNILMREERILFVDFDDARQGPPIQDIWLLLSGDAEEQSWQLGEILEGYEQFNELNLSERYLIEPLRTLRLINQAAWLGWRWDDPTFPLHFPWFGQPRFWSDHILTLREQLSNLQQPPLTLPGQGNL